MKDICWILCFLLAGHLGSAQDQLHHVTLSASEVAGKRVIVIGDVHGCYDEMMTLLRSNNLLTPDEQKISSDAVVIFAGDIINKGPLNIQVLRFVCGSGAHVVFGNHERNILADPGKYPWTSEMTAEEWAWVEDMPYTISIPSLDSIVVHAGLLPDTPLDQQTEFVMTRMRNLEILEDGTMIPHDDRDAGGDNWAIFYSGPYHASYGHDAGRGQDGDGNPIIQWHDKATGLDSRCVYGGRLSGIYLPVNNEAPDVTQVDCEEYDNFAQDIDL